MIGDILLSFLLQIAFTVGIIVLFGFLIALCNKKFYANFGSRALRVCYITGAIGTPLHESAHALMCLLFGHKIVEIKFFQINSDDGCLGYVKHTYNPKNIYCRIGNFFIGVAPIVCISAVLYLLAYVLLPGFVSDIAVSVGAVDSAAGWGDAFISVLSSVPAFFLYAATWQWWVFVLVGIFLALHMTLSKPDIQGAWSGILLLLVAVLIADAILGLVSPTLLSSFTAAVMKIGSWLLSFLVLALLISVLALLLSFVFRLCRRK